MSKSNPAPFESVDNFLENVEGQMEHQKKSDVYQRITDRILSLLDSGTVPWKKSWKLGAGSLPHNFYSDTPYRGINLLLLSCAGFSSPEWLTEKQIQGRHGKIKEGEVPTPVIFYSPARNGGKNYFFLKVYNVYNIEQTEGIKPIKKRKAVETAPLNPIEAAEQIATNLILGPKVVHGESEAPRYNITQDVVYLPNMDQFSSSEEYYSTLFHEITHSTGSKERLKRKSLEEHSMDGYSREELIAEFGSAFLCAQCGISNEVIENQAAYIQGWSKFIKKDPQAFIQAASAAQRAVAWVLKHSKKAQVQEGVKEIQESEEKIAA